MSSAATVCDKRRHHHHYCVRRRRRRQRQHHRHRCSCSARKPTGLDIELELSTTTCSDLVPPCGGLPSLAGSSGTLVVSYESVRGAEEIELVVVCKRSANCCRPSSASATIEFRLSARKRPPEEEARMGSCKVHLDVTLEMLSEPNQGEDEHLGLDLDWPARGGSNQGQAGRILHVTARLESNGSNWAKVSRTREPKSLIKIRAKRRPADSGKDLVCPLGKRASIRLEHISYNEASGARESCLTSVVAGSAHKSLAHLSAGGGFADWPLRRFIVKMAAALCLSQLHATMPSDFGRLSGAKNDNKSGHFEPIERRPESDAAGLISGRTDKRAFASGAPPDGQRCSSSSASERSSSDSSSSISSSAGSSLSLLSSTGSISRLLTCREGCTTTSSASTTFSSGSGRCSSFSASSCPTQSSLSSSCCSLSSRSNSLRAYSSSLKQQALPIRIRAASSSSRARSITSRDCPYCKSRLRARTKPRGAGRSRRRVARCRRGRRRTRRQRTCNERLPGAGESFAANNRGFRQPLIRARASSLQVVACQQDHHHCRGGQQHHRRSGPNIDEAQNELFQDSRRCDADSKSPEAAAEAYATSVRASDDDEETRKTNPIMSRRGRLGSEENHLTSSMNELMANFLECPNCQTRLLGRSQEIMLLNSDRSSNVANVLVAQDNIRPQLSGQPNRMEETIGRLGQMDPTPASSSSSKPLVDQANRRQSASNSRFMNPPSRLIAKSPSISVRPIRSVDLSQDDPNERIDKDNNRPRKPDNEPLRATSGLASIDRPPIMVDQVTTDSDRSSATDLLKPDLNKPDSGKELKNEDSTSTTMNLLSPMDSIWRTSDSRALSCTESSLSDSLVAQLASTRSKSLCEDAPRMTTLSNQSRGGSFKISKRMEGLGKKVGRLTRNALNQIKRLSASNPNIRDEEGSAGSSFASPVVNLNCNYNYGDQPRRGSEKAASSKGKVRQQLEVNQSAPDDRGTTTLKVALNRKLNRFRSVSTAALVGADEPTERKSEDNFKETNDVYLCRNDDDFEANKLHSSDHQELYYSPDGVYIGPGGICTWREAQRAAPSRNQHSSSRRSTVLPVAGSGAASWLRRPLRSSVAQALLGRNSSAGEWQIAEAAKPVTTNKSPVVIQVCSQGDCGPSRWSNEEAKSESGAPTQTASNSGPLKGGLDQASFGRRKNGSDSDLEANQGDADKNQSLKISRSGIHRCKTEQSIASPSSSVPNTAEENKDLRDRASYQSTTRQQVDWTVTSYRSSRQWSGEEVVVNQPGPETNSCEQRQAASVTGFGIGSLTTEGLDLHQLASLPFAGASFNQAGSGQLKQQQSATMSNQPKAQSSGSAKPLNKTWVSNITHRVSNHHHGATKSSFQSQQRSPARKVVTCDLTKTHSAATKPQPAYFLKGTRSNSLSGLYQRVGALDLSESSMELRASDKTNPGKAGGGISMNEKHPACLFSGGELSSRHSASSQELTPANKTHDFDQWFRRSFKQNSSSIIINENTDSSLSYQTAVADYLERQNSQALSGQTGKSATTAQAGKSVDPELYGANLRSICVHCQLIAELSSSPQSLYLSQLLPRVAPQQQQQQERRQPVPVQQHAAAASQSREETGLHQQQRSHDEPTTLAGGASMRPSVVLTVCSNQATLDLDNDEQHSTYQANSDHHQSPAAAAAAAGLENETRTLVRSSRKSRHHGKRKSNSSVSIYSHSSSTENDDDIGTQTSTSATSAEVESSGSELNSDDSLETSTTSASSTSFNSSSIDSTGSNKNSSPEESDNIADDVDDEIDDRLGDDNDVGVENDELDHDDEESSRLSSTDVIKFSALSGAAANNSTEGVSEKTERRREIKAGSGRKVSRRNKVPRGSAAADFPVEGDLIKTRSIVKSRDKERLVADSPKSKKKTKKKRKRKKGSGAGAAQKSTSTTLLEVPAANKQARSASLDAPYLLKVPIDGHDLALEEFPNKSNRSRSVDISLPTRPGELYIVNDGVQPSKDQLIKVGGSAEGVSAVALKKFIQGEIKVPCANGQTRALKLFADWSENCVNGEHLWIYVGSSSEACYVGENECLKHGPRLCCSACKITAHTSCISILIDKIKFICKHTFKDLTISDSRQVKELQQQNVIYHHWVHKRAHCGRCKQCTKTFGNTKLPFSSKEIQAITCSWCKVSYHNKENCYTLSSLTEPCTLGAHRESIIPPTWILKLPISNNTSKPVHGDDEIPKDSDNFMQSDNLIDLSITSKNGATNQVDAIKLSYDNSNKENGEGFIQKQKQLKCANLTTNNNNQYGQQVFGSDTTLMTDTSGYVSADGSNLQSFISNKTGDSLLPSERLKQPGSMVRNMAERSEEIIMDPTALLAADLSIINREGTQQHQARQQQHPQESMSMTRYQKHQLKQYYKQIDAHHYSDQAMKAEIEGDGDRAYDAELQHQNQLQTLIRQTNEGLYQNFRIVPQPVPGVPNAGSKPVLVFANPRSGGNQGAKMMQKFNWLLNPRQVFDLIQCGGPRAALELYRDVPNLRILTIGGDGTASWILSHLDEVGIPNRIPVAVLPLGTGNDLARALGWGGGYADEPIAKILTQVRDGEIVQLDRWNLQVERNLEVAPSSPNEFSSSSGTGYTSITNLDINSPSVTSSPSHFSSLSQGNINAASTISILDQTNCDTSMIQIPTNAPISGFNAPIDEADSDRLPMDVINNYFSFGVDAHIALEFHTAREAHPERFNSRLRNKMFYGQAGGKDLLKRKWKDLSNFVTLYCDGQDMTSRLKELKVHSVLFLNIPSYGGGTRPWPTTATSFAKPRTDDGLIEVIGLTTYQLPLLQAGGHGTCIAQCRSAKIITSRTIPMQVDGEPCKLLPSIININFKNRVCMLAKSKNSSKN